MFYESDRRTVSRSDDESSLEIPWGDRKPPAKVYSPKLDQAKEAASNIYNRNAIFDENTGKQSFQGKDVLETTNYCNLNPTLVYDLNEGQDGNGSNLPNTTKDGVLFPRHSPRRAKTYSKNSFLETMEDSIKDEIPNGPPDDENVEFPNAISSRKNERETNSGVDHGDIHGHFCRERAKSPHNDGGMSRKEILWAALAFSSIVLIAVTTTFLVLKSATNRSGSKVPGDNSNNSIPGENFSRPPTKNSEQKSPKRLSIREEWELVYNAIRDNPLTESFLLPEESVSGNATIDQSLPEDPSFFRSLVSGMVFSEAHRDWIPATFADDEMDDFINIQGLTTTQSQTSKRKDPQESSETPNSLTPHQKATAWLLYHDSLKDPNESVWRWAFASIYYQMGGQEWSFRNASTADNHWFTKSSLCEWEGLDGCSTSSNNPYKLPIDIDFDGMNLSGAIPNELALLQQSKAAAVIANNVDSHGTSTIRSITLTDNRLTGTIPGSVFQQLFPSLGKLYLDNNQLTGTIPSELGGLGDWPEEFCSIPGNGGHSDTTVDNFGLDCDKVACSCCGIFQCYYS